ncbi:thiamine pyrophosphate-dependent dehydrogenase E1 component subunit alpha [bacterium]|nr:thiamine pyrophosphate-dependent dehydrogenase E1 component subunit alpha [bacterium]
MQEVQLHKSMLRIRRFEEIVLKMFDKGLLGGTTHTYIGQEANAIGILSHTIPSDFVFASHRSHGYFLAHGGDMYALLMELMGSMDGVCAGRGGSQHLFTENFISSGVQGGYLPMALGFAYAEKVKKSGSIIVAFIGDGTMGSGVVYETLNMVSLYQVPLLIIIENNGFAQTTPVENNLAGSIRKRVESFGIECDELDTSCVLDIYNKYEKIVNGVRKNCQPYVGILNTCRLMAHSKGDDTRDPEYIKLIWKTRDPIKIMEDKLKVEDIEDNNKDVDAEINNMLEQLGVVL